MVDLTDALDVPVDDALEDVDAAKTLAVGEGSATATDHSHRRLFERLVAIGAARRRVNSGSWDAHFECGVIIPKAAAHPPGRLRGAAPN
jgi:hypothetical protein